MLSEGSEMTRLEGWAPGNLVVTLSLELSGSTLEV